MLSDRKKNAIISGLIVTGRKLGVEIVAEGVETEAEASLLRSMGAQFAQGYLWSKAAPLPQFVDFVRLFGAGVAPGAPDGGTAPPALLTGARRECLQRRRPTSPRNRFACASA